MAADRVFGEGETFSWRGTTFTATKTPGHTEYHCALCFEVDGRRIGGPIFQNRFAPGDFLESVARIRDFEPEFILTGHTGALRIEPAFLDEALVRARSLNDILWGLIAVPEAAGFACDPNWATLYPYQATAQPGEAITLTVRIVNHLNTATTARAELRLPEGWTSEALADGIEIGGGQQGDLRCTVQVPETAAVGAHHVITAIVTLGERRFGPAAEGIIRVVPRLT